MVGSKGKAEVKRKRRKKPRYKIDYFKFFRFLLLTATLIFILYKIIYQGILDPMKSYKPEVVNVTVEEDLTGAVIRKEYIIRARAPGNVVFYVPDRGSFDSTQRLIKYVCESGYNRRSSSLVSKKYDESLEIDDEKISRALASLAANVNDGLYAGVGKEKSTIKSGIKSGFANSGMADYTGNDTLQMRYLGDIGCLKGDTVIFYAPVRGIILYTVDGFEEKMRLSDIRDIDIEKLKDEYSQAEKTEVLSQENATFENSSNYESKKRSFSTDEIVCKLVDESECFIAAEVEISKLDLYKKDESINLVVGENETKAQIIKTVQNDKNGKATVVFKPENYLKIFYGERILPVKAVLEKHKGVAVRRSSIVEKNGIKGVYRLGPKKTPEFTPIIVWSENEKTSIVKSGYITGEINGKIVNMRTVDRNDKILINGSRWNR